MVKIKVKTLKLLLWITLLGLALMAGLIVTGVTLASRHAKYTAPEHTTPEYTAPEEVGIEPMVSLSPTYGGANTLVNITGIGFPPETRIGLYLALPNVGAGSQPHGETFSDEEGRFSVMFPMPAAWPDGTTITDEELVVHAVTEDRSHQASAKFDFIPPVIQPEIDITPTSGPGDTSVTVTSTGFPAGSRVSLHLGPPDGGYGPQTYGEGVADEAGTVTLAFAMPDNWPDGSRVKEEQLEVVAVTEDGAVKASAGFDYQPIPYPLITVSPNYGSPSTPVSITGDGFPAGSHVLIKLGTSVEDAAGREAYVETMADTRGNINVPFSMPGYWPDGLPITVRDVVVLATAADRSGYGWMGFAYLDHAPEEPAATPSGTVIGAICFPSQAIPAMTLYFQNIETNTATSLETDNNQGTYSVELPPGVYIAYAWLPEFLNGGTYSQAVPCGLSVECNDHSPIQFEVVAGQTTAGIDVCDWYGPLGQVPLPPGVDIPMGTVTGQICYPGEAAPPMRLYFHNQSTGTLNTLDIAADQSAYSKMLTPGPYIAYAWLPDLSMGGLYSQAVPCGLSVECGDHSPRAFEVTADQTTDGVDICDWYSPESVPAP